MNEYIPKYVVFKKWKTNIKTKTILYATKRFSIAEQLINNGNCANNYNLMRFKFINSCTKSIDLVRLEAISIYLDKPDLCKQRKRI